MMYCRVGLLLIFDDRTPCFICQVMGKEDCIDYVGND